MVYSYTIPCHLQANKTTGTYACTVLFVHSNKKKKEEEDKIKRMNREQKKEEEKKKEKKKRKERKENKENDANMRSGRRSSPEDEVAVCWYDESCDISSWWTNIRTSQDDQTEGKTTRRG